MAFQRPSGLLPTLASALAAAGIMLAIAGCSHITPLGPDAGPSSMPPARKLGSPIIVQVMRSQSHPLTSGCPAGWLEVFVAPSVLPRTSSAAVPVTSGPVPTPGATTAAAVPAAVPSGGPQPAAPSPFPCYHPVGTPVTITSAAVSSVEAAPSPPNQQNGPALYAFEVTVPAGDVAALTALIAQAYNSRGALGISVAGKLWEAPQVLSAFSGQQLQIAVFTRNQAVKLHRILIPSG